MGWNTPDDCPWTSDLDYYNWLGQVYRPEDEPEEDDAYEDAYDEDGYYDDDEEDFGEDPNHLAKCPFCGTNGPHYCPDDIARD